MERDFESEEKPTRDAVFSSFRLSVLNIIHRDYDGRQPAYSFAEI